MAVYREGYSIIDTIQKQLQQIFDDAADVGAPVNKNDKLWNAIKQLNEWYGVKGSKKKLDDDTFTFEFELMDEWAVSDRRKTEEEATERYKLTYTFLKRYQKKPYLRQQFKGVHGYCYVEEVG